MFLLQRDEDTAAQRRVVFQLVDASTFAPITGETFGTSTDLKVSKNGAAEANFAGSAPTEIGGGYYYYEFTAGELDTEGFLLLRVNISNRRSFEDVVAQVVPYDPNATGWAQLLASADSIVTGTAQTGTLSSTQMTTDLAETTDNHYIGRVVIWTSGVLAGSFSGITDSSGTNGLLTYDATETGEAPSDGDTFVIL